MDTPTVADDPDALVPATVATNPATPADALEHCVMGGNLQILRAAASHPNAAAMSAEARAVVEIATQNRWADRHVIEEH